MGRCSISRPLDHVLEAIDGISQTWRCAKQVRGLITTTMEESNKDLRNESPESFDFMAGLADNVNFNPMNPDIGFEINDANLGLFDPDEFLGNALQWNGDFTDSNIWELGVL